jgi:hypothetical protein
MDTDLCSLADVHADDNLETANVVDVINRHARATNRLAEAIETLAQTLAEKGEPQDRIPYKETHP